MKCATIFKGKLTRGLKHDIRKLVNSYASSHKSESSNFDKVLLIKAYQILGKCTETLSLMKVKSDPRKRCFLRNIHFLWDIIDLKQLVEATLKA